MEMEQTQRSETQKQGVPKRRHRNSNAGEPPKIKNTTFTTRRKFEIKNEIFTLSDQGIF
jgi:hypothetical protein